jgi:hypothetical protein
LFYFDVINEAQNFQGNNFLLSPKVPAKLLEISGLTCRHTIFKEKALNYIQKLFIA